MRWTTYAYYQAGCLLDSLDNIRAPQKTINHRKVKQIKSFLRLCTVYRRFMSGFSRIAEPLNDLLRKEQPQRCEIVHLTAKTLFHVPKNKQVISRYWHYRAEIIISPLKLTREFFNWAQFYWKHMKTEGQKQSRSSRNCSWRPRGASKRLAQMFHGRMGLSSAPIKYWTPKIHCCYWSWSAEVAPSVKSIENLAHWRLRLFEYIFDIHYQKVANHQARNALPFFEINGHDAAEMSEDI